MQIIVTKCGEGKIKTEVDGSGKDLLEMLGHGLPTAAVGDILGKVAGLGLDSAVDEWEKDAKKEAQE